MSLLVQRAVDVKCVVVGDDSVGKTSMLMGYATNRYPTHHVPSVFDNYAGSLTVAGRRVQLQILDAVEGSENIGFRQSLYPGAHIFVVCFSVVKPESLRHVEDVWLPEIRKLAPDTPFILVGAQADLRSVDVVRRLLASVGQRPITPSEGHMIARRVGAAHYFETSPEVEKNVRKLVNSAIASVLKARASDSGACTIL